MNKYDYTIKTVLVSTIYELEETLNDYAKNGFRVTSVARTDHMLHDGNKEKYTVYLERKIKK